MIATSIISELKAFFKNKSLLLKLGQAIEGRCTSIFWADYIMVDKIPFEYERNSLKKGKTLKNVPQNKAYKYEHCINVEGKIMSIYSYIPNYPLPSLQIFIQESKDAMFFFCFDIENKLEWVQKNIFDDNKLRYSMKIYSEKKFLFEKYEYNQQHQLTEIVRIHRDKDYFGDKSFYPDYELTSEFRLTYSLNGSLETINWNATPDRSFKTIYPLIVESYNHFGVV
jgi:hypothetical protein